MIIPISHIHVKVIQRKKHGEQWFALMQIHTGEQVWMGQPMKPKVGSEQILYIVKNGCKEHDELNRMAERGASFEEMEPFIMELAKKYGVFCQKSFAEAEARESAPEPGMN